VKSKTLNLSSSRMHFGSQRDAERLTEGEPKGR